MDGVLQQHLDAPARPTPSTFIYSQGGGRRGRRRAAELLVPADARRCEVEQLRSGDKVRRGGRAVRRRAVWAAALDLLIALGGRRAPARSCRARRRAVRTSRSADRSGILEAQHERVRAGRLLPRRRTSRTSPRTRCWFQHVIPDLVARTKPGGVYLGVGPEQNYTYMAAAEPKMAIIFDIRRGNLDLQLMYKALFELADGPRGLRLAAVREAAARRRSRPSSTAAQIFSAPSARCRRARRSTSRRSRRSSAT